MQVNPQLYKWLAIFNESSSNSIISNSSENSNSFEKKSLGNDKNTENEARFLLKEERQRNITEIPLEQKNIISREDRPHIRFSLSDMQYESQEYIQRKKELREKAIKNPRPAKVLRVFEGKQEKSWRDYFVLLPADFFDDANTGYLGENGFYVLSAISSMEWQNYDHYLIADVDLNYFTEWVADEKEANENGTICQYWSEIMNYDYTEIKASLDDMDAQNVNVYKLPDQIKLTTNLNPTGNEDIRYSLNKYTPKATASAKALIDSEIITNEINAHFWQWHSEAVAELIDKEMAKADERTVAERINSISDKIMQEGKFSKTLDEYTKEILAKNKAEYKAINALNNKLEKHNKELYDGLARSLDQYNKQKNKTSTAAKMYLGNMAGAISYIARNNGVMESYSEIVDNADIYRDYINKKGVEYTSQDIMENKDGVAEQLAVNDAYAKSLENDRAEVEARTAQYKEQFPNMSEQAIKEEIAADYFGKELSGEETFSETFSYKYKSLWARAKLYITNLASKLRGKDRYTHSEVGEVGKLFDELIKNEQYMNKQENIENGLDKKSNIKYSIKGDKKMTQFEQQVLAELMKKGQTQEEAEKLLKLPMFKGCVMRKRSPEEAAEALLFEI